MAANTAPTPSEATPPTSKSILSEAAQKCIGIGDLHVARQLLAILEGGVPIETALVPNANGLVLPRHRARPGTSGAFSDRYQDVKSYVLTRDEALVPDLRKRFDINTYTAKRLLVKLAEEGIVEAKGRPKHGRKVLKKLGAAGQLIDRDDAKQAKPARRRKSKKAKR